MKYSHQNCPGEYEPRTVRHHGRVIVIDHVPADVCTLCGDVLFTPEPSAVSSKCSPDNPPPTPPRPCLDMRRLIAEAPMQLTYDPACNIAYIRLRKKTAKVTTQVISDELNIDMDADGKVYGIELLNANEQLGRPGMKNLVIENRDSGQKVELALAG